MNPTTDISAERPTRRILGLEWPAYVTTAEKRSLIAGGLGWMLDAMDVMLLSMVLPYLMRDLAIREDWGGLLGLLTLGASAVGGALFGFFADRVGRTKALMVSILVYSLASGACGLSSTLWQLAIFRLVLGLGMGGEWTTGAALIAEVWPAAHRGKALGLMQSSWAIGEMLAAGITFMVLPRFGWRAVFFVGVLPALVVFWILRAVPESEIWLERGKQKSASLRLLWRKDIRWKGLLATAMNACGMFGYWGLFFWMATYLTNSLTQAGRNPDIARTTVWLLVMGVGKWFGYTLFGFVADAIGRRTTYVIYLLAAAALVAIYGSTKDATWLLILGPFVAFFGTGFFSGFSAISSELFPTEIRATAMGLTYNIGRGISALAPFAVGALALRYGLGKAFYLQAGAFFLGAMLALALPETKGKQLD
jgi:MFS family permease